MRRQLPPVALALALVAALASAGAAPKGIGQVHGTVFDKERKGVPGLTVALVPGAGATVYGTSTDMDGRYEFKGLDADVYTVMVVDRAGVIYRKDGIRVRSLFRSIVDFNLGTDAPAPSIPVPQPVTAADGDPAASSSELTIACTLTGADRQPVPDASVAATPTAGTGALRRAITDSGGACRLQGIPQGVYRLTARAPGFINWEIGPLTLDRPGGIGLSLALTPYPMGFAGTVEDLLIPTDPVPPHTP